MKPVVITSGIENWQILQQENGVTTAYLQGNYQAEAGQQVLLRVIEEKTNEIIVDFTPANCKDGDWSVALPIPRGGLYRLEAHLECPAGSAPYRRTLRGTVIHHIGAGEVFLIAGQSNAAGTGHGPAADEPELGVHILRDRAYWDLATHPLDAERGFHSPFLAFGKSMKEKLGCPIGLLPYALGGSPLSRWLPEEEGDLFREMMDGCRSRRIVPKAILWYQGCTDAMKGNTVGYLERFSHFVEDCRQGFGDPQLPIFTCQLNRHEDFNPNPRQNDANWAAVREAQRQAARQIPNCSVMTTFDLSVSDGIHNNPTSNLLLGKRLARQVLQTLYGIGSLPADPMDLQQAVMTAPDRLELIFAPVTDRVFLYESGIEAPIDVSDRDGAIPITQIQEGQDRLILTLSRPPKEGAVVSAMAHAKNTRSFGDATTQIPALGFYQVPILN